MLRRRSLCLTLTLALAAMTSQSKADLVVDQQSTFADSYLGPSYTPGQSFTPTLNEIDFATFQLATSDPINGGLVFVTLYQGDGFGGTVIAASSNDVLVQNTLSFQSYEFDFSPGVTLTPGDVYTLQLIDATGQTLYEEEGDGTPYAGGVEYSSDGDAQTGYDMVFSEGIVSQSVPEPGSLIQCVMGLTLFGAWARRRRRVAPVSSATA